MSRDPLPPNAETFSYEELVAMRVAFWRRLRDHMGTDVERLYEHACVPGCLTRATGPIRPVNPRESARIGTKSGRIPGTFKQRKRRSR